ncbi:MAG: S9 family peptidase [Streptosporangiales bacterium]|nr:S9 family peptidase [Streptosporangiales bacterium]MBO0890575.1 S9 family peptidase [Acidothermales bacterium]
MPDQPPFHDLEAYLDLPRVSGLALSPDGSRLVATVSVLSADRKRYVSSLWHVDPAGERPARRLTRSEKGESSPAFLPDGSLLFLSERPDPDAAEDVEDAGTGVWLLPADGGEPRHVLGRPGGVDGIAVAKDSGRVVVGAPVLAGARDADDADLRAERKRRGVSAVLHTTPHVRFWDHDLGPDEPHLLAVAETPWGGDRALRDLTPGAGTALVDRSSDLAAAGDVVVAAWTVHEPGGETRGQVRVIDVTTGEHRVLLDSPAHDFDSPVLSPDGRWVVAERAARPTYDEPPDPTLVLVSVEGGEPRDLLPDLDRFPHPAVWAPDSTAVFTTYDDLGRGRIARVEVESGTVTVLTADDGVYSSLCVSPDGRHVYALRATVAEPPAPVRLDAAEKHQGPRALAGPTPLPVLPGTLTEVTTTADDGVALRGWLALPADASATRPAPLLLWVHGGPETSWNQWQWRWNPWLMVARGYAVLLPDPALSTGYGIDFHRRGWGAWGDRPYTDLMDVTDATLTRPDVDETRTAAMGGSFGGYMANWIATRTDRFRAIVTHASLWALDQFGPTTDIPSYWRAQFGDPTKDPARYLAHSPHHGAASISTPMLVIHGDQDYRVPIGESLRLWSDLARHDVPAQFLYFPDENHWVLKPGNIVAWYETVLAFLAHHVLGEDWARPARI